MNPRNTSSLTQSELAIQIERLVNAIERTDRPAFDIGQSSSGQERVHNTRLARYFGCIQQMFDLFDDRTIYTYSEHLQTFWLACQDIGLERGPAGLTCLNDERTMYLDFERAMNVLVAKIRQLTRSKWYQRKASDRRYEAGEKQTVITDYVNRVLERYSRTVVVRVDLHYLTGAHARLRIEHVFKDLDGLIRARERDPIFQHETGYICSVEQGDARGYHVHAAFFFNGAEVRSDFYKAQQIGELWEQLTAGRGYYYSCNAEKDQYGDEVGIGTIRRDDIQARTKVVKAMHYLTKDTQYLHLKPARAKAFRTGCIRRSTAENFTG